MTANEAIAAVKNELAGQKIMVNINNVFINKGFNVVGNTICFKKD